MSRVTTSFVLPVGSDGRQAALSAASSAGWLVDKVADGEVRLREHRMMTLVHYKARVRVEWLSGEGGIAMTIHGRCLGGGPIQKRYLRGKVGALQAAIESAAAASAAAVPVAVPAVSDVADQLRKLGELRDAGILTTEEFDAKKADLLSRL